MRAKDEFRYIAETYNTKLLLERVVDGKLMCPEACCGSPVLECKCGEDCEHCNCFMIQKAIKSNGLTDKLLKENLRQHQFFKKGIGSAVKEIFDIPKDEPKEDEEKRLRATNVQQMQIIDNDIKNLKISPEEAIRRTSFDPAYHKDLLRRYKKWVEREASFKDIKPASWFKTPEVKEPSLREILGLEDEEEIDIGTMVTWNQDGPMKGEVVDVDIEQGFAVVETGFGSPAEKYVVELGELTKAIPRKPREDEEDKTIKEFYKMRDPDGDGSWPDDDDDRDHPDYGEPEYDDRGTGEIGREDNEEFNRLENKRERARDRAREAEDKGDWDEWNRQENERERSRDQLRDIEDNEDVPKRSITGMKHKLDALAAAQLAGSKHKPYVSSFVGDGGKKIFAILGSDGKIVHKTHDKREAHQWLKDNYENI